MHHGQQELQLWDSYFTKCIKKINYMANKIKHVPQALQIKVKFSWQKDCFSPSGCIKIPFLKLYQEYIKPNGSSKYSHE